MQELPKYIPAKVVNTTLQKIPRKIFQTHETNILPIRMINVGCKSWIEKNPDYEYYFFDNNDRLTFISNNFNSKIVDAYKKITNGAMKSDLFRYCVIYIHGGVYSDIDQVCLKPLSQIITDSDADVVTGIAVNTPHQSFLMYSPKHPILLLAIEQSAERILNNTPLIGKWGWPSGYAGPIALEYAWKTFLNQPRNVKSNGDYNDRFNIILKTGVFYYNNYKFNIVPQSFFELKYLTVKYAGYDEDSQLLNCPHWSKVKKI